MFQNYRNFLNSGKYSELLCHALEKKDDSLAYNTLMYYHLSDDPYKILDWKQIIACAASLDNPNLVLCALENGGNIISALYGSAKGGHDKNFLHYLELAEKDNKKINYNKVLNSAVQSGDLQLIDMCIGLGGEITEDTYFLAAEAKKPEVINHLWTRKKANLNEVIEVAARDYTTFEAVINLLEPSDEIGWRDALITAYETDNKDIIEVLETYMEEDKDEFICYKFVAVAAKGDIVTVKSLLSECKENQYVSAAIYEAAINGWDETCFYILGNTKEDFLINAVNGACLGGYRIILEKLESKHGREKIFSMITEDVLKNSPKNIKAYVRNEINTENREFVEKNSSERERIRKIIEEEVEKYLWNSSIRNLVAIPRQIKPVPNINYTYTISITFGDVAENHVGMEQLGVKSERGYSLQDLQKAQNYFSRLGCSTELYSLHTGDLPEAYILIVRNAVSAMGYDPNSVAKSLRSLTWDSKYYDTRRSKVLNKIARHNLCFRHGDQIANFEEGKGTVIGWSRVPELANMRHILENLMDEKELQAEGNLYYDVNKCGIGWHGDTERRKVIAIRFGQSMKLCYRWYKNSQTISDRMCFDINNGDLYIMSEKAVGTDWKRRVIPTLRHSAGCDKYIK